MKSNNRIFTTAAILLGFALLLPACDGLTGASASTTKKPGGSVKIEDVYAATMALVATTQLSQVFAGDPNAAFDKDAAATANAIEIALKSGASCMAVSRTGAELTLDFGVGCAPPKSPIKLQGKVVATLSIDEGKSMSVAMVLSDFGSADKTATGTGDLTVKKASAGLDVTIALKMAAGSAIIDGGVAVKLTANAAKTGFSSIAFSTVDPTTVTVDKAKFGVTAAEVTFDEGQCYPRSGEIRFNASGIKAKLAFNADTASTGVAQFTPPLSTKAEDKALPGLGWKCQ